MTATPCLKTPTGETSGGQQARGAKCVPYQDPKFVVKLEELGSFMKNSKQGITPGSRLLCKYLLAAPQSVPSGSVFNDNAAFEMIIQIVRQRNESRVLRTVTPFLVPSGEEFAALGRSELTYLAESVDERWNSCIPLIHPGPRPQPDYSIGFGREAFTEKQLMLLKPFVGDSTIGDRSYFKTTYYMYFPFLTCEIKCGALDFAQPIIKMLTA